MSAWAILVSIVTSSGFAPGVFVGFVAGQVATLLVCFWMAGRDLRRERALRLRGVKP